MCPPIVVPRGAGSAEQVAQLLAVVALADGELGAVFDRVAGSRAPIHPATISELERLLEDTLRPAVAARATLAATPGPLLRAGLALYRDRRQSSPDTATAAQ
jgi:hypothetical protein